MNLADYRSRVIRHINNVYDPAIYTNYDGFKMSNVTKIIADAKRDSLTIKDAVEKVSEYLHELASKG